MRATLLALLLCLVSFPLLAGDAFAVEEQEQLLPVTAQNVLARYSLALNQGDCETMLALTSPSVISRMTSRPGSKEGFCEMVSRFQNDLVVETLGKVLEIRSEGVYRMAKVENKRVVGRRDSTMRGTDGFYVLHSLDGGEQWWVLDLSCVDPLWMKEVYPPYEDNSLILGESMVTQEQ